MAKPVEGGPAGGPTQIRIVNLEKRTVQVELLGDQRVVSLAPQAAILLSLSPSPQSPFEMSLRDTGVAIRGVRPGDAKLYETIQKPLSHWTSDGLKHWFRGELDRYRVVETSLLASVIESLQPEFDRTAFSVTPLIDSHGVSPQQSDSLLRQGAILLAALAKKLPESAMLASFLWQVAILFADVARVRLPVEPELATRLLHAAKLDDPTAPVMTYTLLHNTVNASS